MQQALEAGFSLGDWRVRPAEGLISGPDGDRHVEPKVMDVLLCLSERAGEVVSHDTLIREVWADRALSDEPLFRCIAELRRSLGDSADSPQYIKTVRKRGYRLIALGEDHWRVARARGTLGAALAGLERYAEAEPLLLESYESMAKKFERDSETMILARGRLRELYEAWDKPELARRFAPGQEGGEQQTANRDGGI